MTPPVTAKAIRAKALEIGFADCGIVPLEAFADYEERLAERIERFPAMRGPFGRLAALAHPDHAFPWARSVIVAVHWYGHYRLPTHMVGHIARTFLTDGRKDPQAPEYRKGQEFTEYLRATGFQVATGNPFGFVPLRWAAMKARLGVVRKNNFLYTERGSWLWLDAWLIDGELELIRESAAKPCPASCTLCRKACPTGALADAYVTDATTCVTTRNAFVGCRAGDPLACRLGGWLYGCDACQEACPMNRGAWTEDDDFPGLDELAERLDPERILSMDYAEIGERLASKFFYIGADDGWKWKTSALNVLNNGWREACRPLVEAAQRDERAEVRDMAEWVLAAHPPEEGNGQQAQR